MIHYHGGPITPDTCALRTWRSRHAFISFAHQQQMELAAAVTQSFALDNGAFSYWKKKRPVDWSTFYKWVDRWRNHPRFDFAVVPDVIEGTEAENDALAESWPFDRHEAAVVWHTNESPERLVRLARSWPRVAIGSSGQYDARRPVELVQRMKAVLPPIIDANGFPICKLHGLRMLNSKIFKHLPLKSADSTNVAMNVGQDDKWKKAYVPSTKEGRATILVERIEFEVSASRFSTFNDDDEI